SSAGVPSSDVGAGAGTAVTAGPSSPAGPEVCPAGSPGSAPSVPVPVSRGVSAGSSGSSSGASSPGPVSESAGVSIRSSPGSTIHVTPGRSRPSSQVRAGDPGPVAAYQAGLRTSGSGLTSPGSAGWVSGTTQDMASGTSAGSGVAATVSTVR